MLNTEKYTYNHHLSTNISNIAQDSHQHRSVSPNNFSLISKSIIKSSVNKNLIKPNVKKILYSNIMSNFKEDIVNNKTNSQDKFTARKITNNNKVLLNKSNSVKPKNTLLQVKKSDLNITKDKKDASFLSSNVHSPGYSKGRAQFNGINKQNKKTLSTKSNHSRDIVKNNRDNSKPKMQNDITVSDHNKTFTDRRNSKTPTKSYNRNSKNSRTPRGNKNNFLNIKTHNDNNISKLDTSKSSIKRNQEKNGSIKNEDSYLNAPKYLNSNTALYSSFLKKLNPKRIKGNIFKNQNEVKRIAPIDKKSATLPIKEIDVSQVSISTKEDRLSLSLTKNTVIKDDAKEKEKFERNMNSLINIENFKKENLKNSYNFKENTTSPIGKRKDRIEENINIFTKIPSNLMKNNVIESNNKITNENENKIMNKKIRNICDLTKMGFSSNGSKKVNQDNFFIKYNFNHSNGIYLGVCDGHGQLGHLVSSFLKENLPISLEKCIKRRYKANSQTNIKNNLNKIIEDVFLDINNKLCNQQPFDTNFSGSTCCSVIFNPEKLICANVGDSRAVLGRFVNNEWRHFDLSRDHKPNDVEEKKRILSKGGRVEPFRDESGEYLGPSRVWLYHDDVPGLAMSRSFADQVAASVGVIAVPEITEWILTNEDKFFIIASDGVWEFIESGECVNMIKDYYMNNDISGAAEYLMKESTSRWMRDDDSVDDITLIIVFFE